MKDRYLKYMLLAPALLICAATLFYPLVQSLNYSLHDWSLARAPEPEAFIGWANYVDLLWYDPEFLGSAWVTLVFTVPSVLLTIGIAMGMALLLAGDGRLQINARTLLVIPFAMSPALIGISWRFMLNPEFGAVDAVLKALVPGWSGAPVLADPTLAMMALIAVDVWHWAPYFMLTFVGALAALPQDTLDAAQVDGAGVTLALVVAEDHARREREEIARGAARHVAERRGVQQEIARRHRRGRRPLRLHLRLEGRDVAGRRRISGRGGGSGGLRLRHQVEAGRDRGRGEEQEPKEHAAAPEWSGPSGRPERK